MRDVVVELLVSTREDYGSADNLEAALVAKGLRVTHDELWVPEDPAIRTPRRPAIQPRGSRSRAEPGSTGSPYSPSLMILAVFWTSASRSP